jgi:hypothetical protein
MLLFYNTPDLCDRYNHISGVDLINDHRKIIGSNNSMFFDRTETFSLPILIKNQFPIPKVDDSFTKTYEDICNQTAMEIVNKATNSNKKIRVLWSGGIDSTLILATFLKQGHKNLLEVGLSIESIAENYHFYKNHLLGRVALIPATDLRSLASENYILVGGEYNDQLLGSNLLPTFVKYFDVDKLHDKFNIDQLKKVFSSRYTKNVDFWIDVYLSISKKSPVQIKTNLDFHWWINFACKWQGLYYRLASYFPQGYNLKNYYHFFQTEDFQRWSLINHSQPFDRWEDYKRVCKDLIWGFDKNDEYRDKKIKLESLTFLAQKNTFCNYIDEHGRHHQDLPDDCLF